MNLKLNSWHAWLYKNTYIGLPDSLCIYFWKLLLAIVIFPIGFVGYLIPNIREEKSFFLNTIITSLTFCLMMVCWGIGDRFLPGSTGLYLIYVFLIGLGVVVLSLCAFILAFLLISKIIDKYVEWQYSRRIRSYYDEAKGKPKKQYILTQWWKGFIGKYCPKITWE